MREYTYFFFYLLENFQAQMQSGLDQRTLECGRIPRPGLRVELLAFIFFPRTHRHKDMQIFHPGTPFLVNILAVFF